MGHGDPGTEDRVEPARPGDPDDVGRDALSSAVSDRRRLVISLIVGLLLAAGVILLIGKVSGYAKLTGTLRDASPGWLVAGLAAQAASLVGYVLAFRSILGGGRRRTVGMGTSAHIVLASLGATRLLAAAGAGGLAVNYWALRKLGVAARESVIRVLALNTLLYAIFGTIGMVSAAVLLVNGGAPRALALTWIVVVAGCFVAARVVSSPSRAGRLSREPPPDGGRTRVFLRRGFAMAVAAVARVREDLAHPRGHRELIGGSLLYWVGDIACLWMGLRAFGIHTSAGVVVLGYATGYVANVVPLPTGGVGGVDAAMTFALHALGVPLEGALAGVIAYRFIGFWLPTIPAAWALITLPGLGRTLEADRDAYAAKAG
jgi:uncharacterized membrane protein YbhN (UPF0104 family)